MATCRSRGVERGGAPHVLAVDDSSVDRAVISGILRSSQFRGELLALLLLYHILSILVLLLTCACV
jgi:CheY-like chemotaxis protein